MLNKDPEKRPLIEDLLSFEWFTYTMIQKSK